MKKILIALIAIILLVAGYYAFSSMQRARNRKALAAYQAQLRTQGEWLTLADAGYPFALETNANLTHFVALADQLRGKSSLPGMLLYQPYAGPGRLQIIWRAPMLPASGSNVAPVAWARLAADCDSAAEILAMLRAELAHPPRRFGWDYTNPFATTPKNPFVQKRVVAQFFAADTLVALHDGQLPRAQSNLHALTQLVQVHRDDFTLVSAMIRVAIAGLSLSATAQALPADGWDESSLLALQQDWQAIDLGQALETGMVGERLFGLTAFEKVRQAGLRELFKLTSLGSRSSGGLEEMKDHIAGASVSAYWRSHMDMDQLFYLRHMQGRMELIRQLRTNASGCRLSAAIATQQNEFQAMLSAPLAKYQYRFSANVMPSYARAFDTTIRNETERRLTVTAIALKRFHLRHGRHPETLAELVPQFLSAVPIDPWSGEPLAYRRNAAGGFTLYSVGEDGRDDGGDITSATPARQPDLWSGRDAVWPEAVPSP